MTNVQGAKMDKKDFELLTDVYRALSVNARDENGNMDKVTRGILNRFDKFLIKYEN